jgi:FAD/FMN-containing dehydrogenase
MDAQVAELTEIAGDQHVFTDPDLVAGYETDWTRRFRGVARCVVRPGDADQVARVLLACARHDAPVVPQGGNTGLAGGGVPPAGGAVVLSAPARSCSATSASATCT